MKDYYDILKVDRNVSDQELKKAYRKIAMKNHPDRNPDDKNAEIKFKEAAAAYSVLSDPQKRKQYDTFGHEGVSQASQGGGFGGFNINVEDIFNSVFGGGGGFGGFEDLFGRSHSGRSNRVSAGDLKIKLKLTLDEIFSGVQKKVRVKRYVRNGKPSTKCSTCNGNGEVRVVQRSMLGQIVNVQPCSSCKGMGQIGGTELASTPIEIDIPAGVNSGQYLTLKGKGNEGISNSLDGDLVVYFEEIEHDFFRRDDLDIYLQSEIQFHQAVIGTTIEVPTLSGFVKLKIPQNVKNGQILRLRGKGMKKLNSHRFGDQYIRVTINIPKKITKKTHKLLLELSQEIGDKVAFKKIDE
jgi:molecular chaperone DnaJ